MACPTGLGLERGPQTPPAVVLPSSKTHLALLSGGEASNPVRQPVPSWSGCLQFPGATSEAFWGWDPYAHKPQQVLCTSRSSTGLEGS